MRMRERWATPQDAVIGGLLLRDTEADIAAKKDRAFISYLRCEGADAAALLARESIELSARHGGKTPPN
jgi:hypothetical protein